MNLYLLNYNNYYNRIVKFQSTIEGYLDNILGSVIPNVNFNPNDGVNTEQVINWQYEDPDYLVVTNTDNSIDSRWFVIENTRLRNGQYRLKLKRDSIADNFLSVIKAPCFIEKATLPSNDPMIFNSEDMSFNQIKTGETLLKDETDCPWIVGYMSSKREQALTATYLADQPISRYIDNIENYEYFNKVNQTTYGSPVWLNYNMKASSIPRYLQKARELYFAFNKTGPRPTLKFSGGWNETVYGLAYINESPTTQKIIYSQSLTPNNQFVSDTISMFTPVIDTMDDQVGAYIRAQSSTEFSTFINENGKIISDTTTGRIYRVVITPRSNEILYDNVASGNLFNTMKTAVMSNSVPTNNGSNWPINTGNGWEDPDSTSFSITYEVKKYVMTLEEILENYEVTIPSVTYKLNDAPYDMFCIPYSDELDVYKNSVKQFTTTKISAFEAAMELARKYAGGGVIYDVQLLPYCPVRYCIKDDGTFDYGDNQVSYIVRNHEQAENVNIVLYANTSTFTFNIDNNISITNKKIQAMTDMHRLCSPNYNGLFEFNAAKNDGVDYFNIDCTYKPFNPYIHINPNFKELYGQDYNDARGLICGGDFSLPIVTDAWETYALQNKNYQNIFDRQIQNMEVNNSVQKEREIWQVGIGALSAGISGVTSAALAGVPGGALIGAATGAASLGAGIRDVQLNNQLRNEALDYSKDQFGYQLQNIQALPQSISKTTAFVANNKIFPFLEYYTCTTQERIALENKLKYNGMTVMRIGKIEDYILDEPSYIKGQLIRLEGIKSDFHLITDIASEIYKGVFI